MSSQEPFEVASGLRICCRPLAARFYADVMQERGNRYQAHLAEVVPNVLSFEAEPCHASRQVGAAGQLYTGPHRPARRH